MLLAISTSQRQSAFYASYSASAQMSRGEKLVFYQISSYIGIFIFCYFFGLLNRAVEGIAMTANIASFRYFPTTVLHAIFLPLQGFLNCVVYSGFVVHVANTFGWGLATRAQGREIKNWTRRDSSEQGRILDGSVRVVIPSGRANWKKAEGKAGSGPRLIRALRSREEVLRVSE